MDYYNILKFINDIYIKLMLWMLIVLFAIIFCALLFGCKTQTVDIHGTNKRTNQNNYYTK